jgi:hypothetical protein
MTDWGSGDHYLDPFTLDPERTYRGAGVGQTRLFPTTLDGSFITFSDRSQLKDVQVRHWKADGEPQFTGTLIDARGVLFPQIHNVYVGGISEFNATALGVDLDAAEIPALTDVHIVRNLVGVQGRRPGSFCNTASFHRCLWWRNRTHIMDAGNAWYVQGNIGPSTGDPQSNAGLDQVLRLSPGHTDPLRSVTFQVWHGDVGHGTGFEIEGYGFRFAGTYGAWQVGSDPHVVIKAVGPVDGLDLSNAVFKDAGPDTIDLGGQVTHFSEGIYL